MSTNEINVRPLQSADWPDFKDIRLLALRTTPGAFSASYEASLKKTPEDWQTLIQGPGRQVFGLFHGTRMIGITGILTDGEDVSGQTAILIMSFILPEYRGRGLSTMLYDARFEWAKQHPPITKIIVSHRQSNEASRRANQHHGFRFVSEKMREWPDGIEESELFYEKLISESD